MVEGRGRLLVVQRTGWGKSFVYFIATKLLREAGVGPTLLISPLLALMRNQIEAAERIGVRAAPEWVTCIPSTRHPRLVPDFADRVAAALGLPFHVSLAKVEERAEQKSMKNSVQQACNVDGSLEVSLDPLPGPVLLVDDMVDSRWTLTVAAWLLRSHGSGEVWPLALALAGQE